MCLCLCLMYDLVHGNVDKHALVNLMTLDKMPVGEMSLGELACCPKDMIDSSKKTIIILP
jgi:hypothetical protein